MTEYPIGGNEAGSGTPFPREDVGISIFFSLNVLLGRSDVLRMTNSKEMSITN
jgi:hypothetical protein